MTIDELMTAFGTLASPLGTSPEDTIASFILARLDECQTHQERVAFIAASLQAYAKLLQDAGVKITT